MNEILKLKDQELSGRVDHETEEVVNFALDAGRILLKNGAEIFRVAETIKRICKKYGVEKVDTFTLSHGLFVSAENKEGHAYTKMQHVPLSGAHLGIVADVNALSRQIAEGDVPLEEARQRLAQIEKAPSKRWYVQVFGAGAGAAGLGYITGASMVESFFAFGIGAAAHAWSLFAGRLHLSKIVVNIIGGILITILAILSKLLFPVLSLRFNGMIVGAIMPLIPGVAFTNAIRDLADSDYLSGTVRMLDAVLVFVYIAVGVGCALAFYNQAFGGVIL